MVELDVVTAGEVDVLRTFARRIDAADPGAHNNLGVLYFRRGLVDEAIAEFSCALALDERMRVARRNLEIAYGGAGIPERRALELEQRLAEVPDDIGALVESGIAEKSAGRLDQAEARFQRALELDPESSVLHFFLAEIFYNRGNGEEALRFLRRSIDLNPANPDAHYLAGFILGDLGMVEEARDANRRAVALNPRLSRAEANLSLDNVRGGPTPASPVATKPERVEVGTAHLTLALALRLKGYNSEAMRECRAAFEAGEDPPAVLETLASLHLMLGQPSDALDAYETRIRLGGVTPRIMNQRGIALYLLGRTSEAEQTFRDAIVRAGKYAAGENNLGALLWDRGSLRDATNCFRRAVRDDDSVESARLNLALALFRQGFFQLSLDAYRGVVQRQPDHAAAWSGIGRVMIEFGKFAEARDACVRAIQADPSHAQAHVTLSTAFRALGDEEGAAEEEAAARRLDSIANSRTMTLEMDAPENSASVPRGATAASAVPDFGLAADYLSKGLYDRAAAEVRRAMAQGAGDKEGLVLLARCHAARGDYDVAEKELSAALGALPSDEAVAVELASVHRAMGRPADALRRAVGLLRSNVYQFAALVVLGESLLDLKRTRDAARAFARVLKFDPNHALARKYSQLARLESR